MVKMACFPALLSENCWASHIFLNTDVKRAYVCLIFQVFLSPIHDHQWQGLSRKDSQNHSKLHVTALRDWQDPYWYEWNIWQSPKNMSICLNVMNYTLTKVAPNSSMASVNRPHTFQQFLDIKIKHFKTELNSKWNWIVLWPVCPTHWAIPNSCKKAPWKFLQWGKEKLSTLC